MKGLAGESSDQRGRKGSFGFGRGLRRIAVLGGIAILALVFGSMLVDVPLLGHRPQEAGSADSPKIKGIENPKNLPLLLDFGRGLCIPCKMMKPILEEVAREYDGKLLVKILEIDQYQDLMKQFRIHLIPTQIFIDSKGKVFHRHEGFMDKASVVVVLNQMGVKK
jgi:thiol-disulfide isomerase/thioredoxin